MVAVATVSHERAQESRVVGHAVVTEERREKRDSQNEAVISLFDPVLADPALRQMLRAQLVDKDQVEAWTNHVRDLFVEIAESASLDEVEEKVRLFYKEHFRMNDARATRAAEQWIDNLSAAEDPHIDPINPESPDTDVPPRLYKSTTARWAAIAELATMLVKNNAMVELKSMITELRHTLNESASATFKQESQMRNIKGAVGATSGMLGVASHGYIAYKHIDHASQIAKIENTLGQEKLDADNKYNAAQHVASDAKMTFMKTNAEKHGAGAQNAGGSSAAGSPKDDPMQAHINAKKTEGNARVKYNEKKHAYDVEINKVRNEASQLENMSRGIDSFNRATGAISDSVAENAVKQTELVSNIIHGNRNQADSLDGEHNKLMSENQRQIAEAMKDHLA